MKILVVQETDWITRYPHTQHHLFERLALRGHAIRVIDYGFDWKKDPARQVYRPREVFSGVSKICPGAGIDVVRPSSLQVPLLAYLWLVVSHAREIERQIREFSPDLIVGFGILNTYMASVLARRHRIPFAYYWIDALDTLIPEPYLQAIGRFFEKRTIGNSGLLIVTNEKLKDHLAGLGADPSRIECFSSGIDLSRFSQEIRGETIRKRYGIGPDRTVLFFMGWIYHFSGIKEIALQLAHETQGGERDPLLMVVGEGDAYEDLIAIRDQHHLDGRVILTGKQPYALIPEFIAAADICILPAYPDEKIMQDIVPIKLFEYMAVGKPVITTRLSGIIREFGEGNGIVYVSSPSETLLAARDLVRTGRLEDLGRKARECVIPKDWDRITDRFEQSLERLAGR